MSYINVYNTKYFPLKLSLECGLKFEKRNWKHFAAIFAAVSPCLQTSPQSKEIFKKQHNFVK